MWLPNLFRQKSAAQTATQPAIPPSVAIEVSKVVPADALLPEVAYKVAVEALITGRPSRGFGESRPSFTQGARTVEACSRYHGQLVAGVGYHPLVAAIHMAFNDHRPLVLSPDMLWLLVAQGLANHVNANAEELRPKFVKHQGKVDIEIRRDDFVKGSPENPWSEVFSEFSTHIREHVGATTHDLLLPRFSTTGAAERAAAEVVLLDAMQSFFKYTLKTRCGIPQIVLEGSPSDWQALAERTRAIGQFGLHWWTKALEPILNEFIAASHGRTNVGFWQSIYKLDGGSGGPYVNGWILAFFPYMKDWQTGLASDKNPELAQGRCGLDRFPSGLARAPFVWNYLERSYPMEFLGGFVGVQQEADTHRLRPEIGWAVREQPAE